MRENEVIDNLGTYLEQLVADDQFSGTVLVAKDATILFKHAYGWASQDFEVPIDTYFRHGFLLERKVRGFVGQAQNRERLSGSYSR